MSDDVDLAQRFEEFRRDQALAAVQADAALLARPIDEGRACVGCGEEIEAERLEALPGARHCLQCQEARERNRRLFPRGCA